HAPTVRDGRQLLEEALARAKRENKRVIVQETATWCGPCWMLSRFLEEHKEAWQGDYILVKMDHRWDHAVEIMNRIRDNADGGIPWWAILNENGETLTTSNAADGTNIGFPGSEKGRRHFRTMLQQTAIRMTAEQIDHLTGQLKTGE
ncbi:MAG: thioredoxin family protein, partial [Planctomycetota bacterium]